MPMNADGMASEIDALMPALEEADARAARLESLKAICRGIVAHIQANATLLSTGPVEVGLTTAPGGGPVTGLLVVTTPVIK